MHTFAALVHSPGIPWRPTAYCTSCGLVPSNAKPNVPRCLGIPTDLLSQYYNSLGYYKRISPANEP